MLYLLIGSACFAFEADSIVYYHYAYVKPVPQPAEDEIIALRYYQKAIDLVFGEQRMSLMMLVRDICRFFLSCPVRILF